MLLWYNWVWRKSKCTSPNSELLEVEQLQGILMVKIWIMYSTQTNQDMLHSLVPETMHVILEEFCHDRKQRKAQKSVDFRRAISLSHRMLRKRASSTSKSCHAITNQQECTGHFRIISSVFESLWHKKVGQSLKKSFLWTGVQQTSPDTRHLKVHGITCGWTRLHGHEKEIKNTVKVLHDR
jgi:hypothetical protein